MSVLDTISWISGGSGQKPALRACPRSKGGTLTLNELSPDADMDQTYGWDEHDPPPRPVPSWLPEGGINRVLPENVGAHVRVSGASGNETLEFLEPLRCTNSA